MGGTSGDILLIWVFGEANFFAKGAGQPHQQNCLSGKSANFSGGIAASLRRVSTLFPFSSQFCLPTQFTLNEDKANGEL
jgi:hypothetical protein